MTGWRTKAFAAHAAGDPAGAMAALGQAGSALFKDGPALQLLALVSPEPGDARALFAHAALDVEPADAHAFFNLGVSDQMRGQSDLAILRYEQALRLAPGHLGALNNLSDLLRLAGRTEDAWTAMQAFLRHGGDPAGLELRFAKIADECGQAADACHWFALARARQRDDVHVQWEQCLQQLRDEDFAQGWRNYEARRAKFPHQALAIVSYAMPGWSGEPLKGRSLLVHKEQGLGDTMMFASCLADLPGDAGALHLAVHPALVRLFAASFPRASVWPSLSTTGAEDESHQPWRAHAGPIDLQIPIGSLPAHLRAGGFPPPRPYLKPLERDVRSWRDRLAALSPQEQDVLKVGLAFAARRDGIRGPGIAEGESRSVPPALLGLLKTPNVRWYGLLDRSLASELARIPALGVLNTSDWIHDLADTAALIAQLDVVVTVDTSIAHLAGAMGKTVLLMLPRRADWRWGRTRTDSYWYPAVEIFRQTRERDWSELLLAVQRRLEALSLARDAGRARA